MNSSRSLAINLRVIQLKCFLIISDGLGPIRFVKEREDILSSSRKYKIPIGLHSLKPDKFIREFVYRCSKLSIGSVYLVIWSVWSIWSIWSSGLFGPSGLSGLSGGLFRFVPRALALALCPLRYAVNLWTKKYKIEVTSISNGSAMDTSDRYFTIMK